MGDCKISKNCIIGYNSFVKGQLSSANTIVAGIPARTVRHDVTWNSEDLAPDSVGLKDLTKK
jgi:serine acetyltransferase